MATTGDKMMAAILALAGLLGLAKSADKAIGTSDPLVGSPVKRTPLQERRTRDGEIGSPPRAPQFDFSTLDDLYRLHGNLNNLDWKLLKAIARVESSENANAINPNDPSIGLMQILCIPDATGKCTNKFNVEGWSNASRERLLDPDFNLHIAAQILRWNLDTFGFPRGIAVYNAWGARHDPPNGPFRNQGYVDKIMRELSALGSPLASITGNGGTFT